MARSGRKTRQKTRPAGDAPARRDPTARPASPATRRRAPAGHSRPPTAARPPRSSPPLIPPAEACPETPYTLPVVPGSPARYCRDHLQSLLHTAAEAGDSAPNGVQKGLTRFAWLAISPEYVRYSPPYAQRI